MRMLEQILLTFLLNASWQVSLIVTFAVVCDWLLRGVAARYRHVLWVLTLVACLALPVVSCVRFARATSALQPSATADIARPIVTSRILTPGVDIDTRLRERSDALLANEFQNSAAGPSIRVNPKLALLLTVFYGLLLGWRLISLFRAWHRTRGIVKSAFECDFSESFRKTIATCQAVIHARPFRILCSAEVAVPITIGIFKRFIILPQRFEREVDTNVLRSAIGHELVHIARRDYLTNLIYEFVYVPLSFHPAAAFARRRIKHTRELCCDETVAAKLIKPEIYARSLISLIGSAPIWRPLAPDTTIGINESDILEVRIMSLLKNTKFSPRRRTLLLIAAALLLVVPCVAAARFALSFDTAIQEPSTASEPPQKEKREARQREDQEKIIAELLEEASALKQRIQQAPEKERVEIEGKLREVERAVEAHKRALELYRQDRESLEQATRESAEKDEARLREEREAKEKLELEQRLDSKDRKARLIYHIEPTYPPDAREKKIEGSVLLGFTVNHDGNTESIQVKRSVYPSIDQAAVEAVSKWRFEPAMKNGEPVSMWMEAEINFDISDKLQRGEAITRDGKTEYQGEEYRVRLSQESERRKEQQGRLELARQAKISMDQAIQIATSRVPGKVLECSLVGERWKEEGELAKPSLVLYHVVILSGDDANPVAYHVLINAVDGSLFRTEKEERRKELSEEPSSNGTAERKNLEGGVLNGRAISLPPPEYPTIAKRAGAAGAVEVRILVDETGNVIEARAVSGHPLLQAAAVSAARQAQFAPTKKEGQAVQVKGTLVYNFVAQ